MSAEDLPERLRRLAQRTDAPPPTAHAASPLNADGPSNTLTPPGVHALGAMTGQGLVESAEPTPTPPRQGPTDTGFADAIWAQESRPEHGMTGAGRDIDLAMNGLLPQHRAPPAAFGPVPQAPVSGSGSGSALGFGGVASEAPLGPTYATLPREQVEPSAPSPDTTGSWLTRGSNMVALAVLIGGLVFFTYKYARSVFSALSVSVANPSSGASGAPTSNTRTPAGSETGLGYESETSNEDGDPELGLDSDDGKGTGIRTPNKPAVAEPRRPRRQRRKPRKKAAAVVTTADPQFRPLDGTEAPASAQEA